MNHFSPFKPKVLLYLFIGNSIFVYYKAPFVLKNFKGNQTAKNSSSMASFITFIFNPMWLLGAKQMSQFFLWNPNVFFTSESLIIIYDGNKSNMGKQITLNRDL